MILKQLEIENSLLQTGSLESANKRALDPASERITSGCDQAIVMHKPRLHSDNGSSYVATNLADYLEAMGMDHVRGAPYHPQAQGSEQGQWPQWRRVSPRRSGAGIKP